MLVTMPQKSYMGRWQGHPLLLFFVQLTYCVVHGRQPMLKLKFMKPCLKKRYVLRIFF